MTTNKIAIMIRLRFIWKVNDLFRNNMIHKGKTRIARLMIRTELKLKRYPSNLRSSAGITLNR